MENNTERNLRRTKIGVVTSNKMDKTITVSVVSFSENLFMNKISSLWITVVFPIFNTSVSDFILHTAL